MRSLKIISSLVKVPQLMLGKPATPVHLFLTRIYLSWALLCENAFSIDGRGGCSGFVFVEGGGRGLANGRAVSSGSAGNLT